MKKKKLVDYFGWPLPQPNSRISTRVLVTRIQAVFAQLESRAITGDKEAMREFERLLSVFGKKHQHLLRERAKEGDKSFHGGSSIIELIWTAEDAAECLAWLAKNRPKDCERHAANRLSWPGLISYLPSIERKSQELKRLIPLGRNFKHYDRRRTQADSLFRAAQFVIKYVSRNGGDSYSGIYYAPFIDGVLWMKSPERHEAINAFGAKQGALTRDNWQKWKPVLSRVVTFYYGPSWERWKLMPDLPLPQSMLRQLGKSGFQFKTYKDICPAQQLGVLNEWREHLSKSHKLTKADKADIQKWINAIKNERPCIMDIEPDDTLKNLHARVARRDGGWGDFKNEILNRCKRLLPKN